MRKVLTTLSVGETYTRHYTLKLIEDTLNITPLDIYIVTDFRSIIEEKYANNPRIFIQDISRDEFKLRIPIGPNKGADDFNFNLRYRALEFVQDLDDTFIIFTDCDNSVDWWDDVEMDKFIDSGIENGYDFYGPRTDLKLKSISEKFYSNSTNLDLIHPDANYDDHTIFWHKFYNYDCLNGISEEWKNAPLPAEYMLLFYNTGGKLRKMVEQWKYFFNYLQDRDYGYGTWAEGFEIGISTHLAGFNPKDISFSHPIWNRFMMPSGYKNGHKGDVSYATER
jgi:hypothetical protein